MSTTANYNPTRNKSIPLTNLIMPISELKGRVVVIRNSRDFRFGAHKLFTGSASLEQAVMMASLKPEYLGAHFRMHKNKSNGLYLCIQSKTLLPKMREYIQQVSEIAAEENIWVVVQLNMPLGDDTYDHAMYADIAIDLDPEVELNGILLKNRLAYGVEVPCLKTNIGK
jgi:hypothetical protein